MAYNIVVLIIRTAPQQQHDITVQQHMAADYDVRSRSKVECAKYNSLPVSRSRPKQINKHAASNVGNTYL
jgi:hypothetical protein